MIECPGCGFAHVLNVAAPERPKWTWNGSLALPTLSPSLLVTWPRVGTVADGRCHSFVRDGRIQFLSDCTHALAGQTVDLPEVDEET